MKKSLSLLMLLLGLFGCSDDSFIAEDISQGLAQEESQNNKPALKHAADGKYDLLGFSYDVTGEYLHVDEARRTVIDIEAFVRDHKDRFYNPGSTIGNIETYAGATAIDMVEEMTQKATKKTGVSVGKWFSGSIKKSTEYQTKYSYSSKYSFARGDVRKRVKRLYLNADLEMLRKYIKPVFFEDLNRLSADQFVNEYGTHVMTDITIGGRLTFMYRSTITEENNYSRKKEIAEGGLKFTIGKFGADRNNSHEKESIKSLNTKNASWETRIIYHGGERSGYIISYDSQTGHPSQTFNIDSWEASVNDKNAALVDMDWDKTYYIYEFISEPAKKEQIKVAVERYIASKKIEVMQLTPLYRIYDKKDNSFCTGYYDEAKIFVNKGWCVWDDGWNHMNKSHIQGYMLKNQIAGTIPLYRIYNMKNNVACTTNYEEGKLLVNAHGWVWDDGLNHMNKTSIQGYVYKSQIAGTIPLYRLYDKNWNNACTSYYDEASILVNRFGWTWDDGWNHMNKTSILGYIYPY